LNLDCPGCRSRLKLDPAKLPAGATTAVCPKCRTRILLPGTAPGGTITIQCSHCSARLKVKVTRLKPEVSQSKCPKCAKPVSLPAAPPGEATAAMTRRLDPRDLGLVLGREEAPSGQRPEAAEPQAAAPISVDQSFSESSTDLSRLIDEKIEGLGMDTVPTASAPPAAPPAPPEIAPVHPAASSSEHPIQEPISVEEPSEAAELSVSLPPPSAPDLGAAKPHQPVTDSRPSASGARRISSGSRPARRPVPTFGRTAPKPGGAPVPPLMIGGVIGGAVLGGLTAAAFWWGRIPTVFLPTLPEAIASAVGPNVGFVLLSVVLTAAGVLLGGLAFRPSGTEESAAQGRSRISVFHCFTGAALLGLLGGAVLTVIGGGFQILPALAWAVELALAGLLAGVIARLLAGRS
jgi:hypothetical protein